MVKAFTHGLQTVRKNRYQHLYPLILTLTLLQPLSEASSAVHAPPAGLVGALQAVIGNHPAVTGKQAEVTAKRYAVDSAKARRYPSLSAEVSYQEHDEQLGTLRLQQPLWAFGKIDTPILYAEADVVAEQSDLLQVKRQLLEDTAVAYAIIEGIRQRQRVTADNVTEHNQLYQQIERRQKGLLASEADVRLAYSRLIQAESQQAQMGGELQVALTELQALTQIEVASGSPIKREWLRLPELPQLEVLALEQSASVEYKRAMVELARLGREQADVAMMPTLSFRVDHDFLDRPANSDNTHASLVLEGSLEGLGLAASGRTKAATARVEAARQDLRVTQNDIRRRISTLLSSRNIQQRLIQSQQLSVAALKATLDSYMRQYDAGRKAWLEVLNIQRELTEQRLQEVQMDNDWLIYSLRITTLTGQLDVLAGMEKE